MIALPDSRTKTFLAALMGSIGTLLDIPMKEGYLNGPLRDTPALGCVWVANVAELGSNVLIETIEARARIFLAADQQPEEDVPLSMTPLYDVAEYLQVQMGDASHAIGGVWFARLTEWEVNAQQYGVELRFLAYDANKWTEAAPGP